VKNVTYGARFTYIILAGAFGGLFWIAGRVLWLRSRCSTYRKSRI